MMRKNSFATVLSVLGVAALFAGNLHAQLPPEFSEDFNSMTLGANIVVTGNIPGAPAPDTSAGSVLFDAAYAGNAGRNYVATTDAGYADVNFTAAVNVEIISSDPNVTTDNGAAAFFGIGSGTSDGEVPAGGTAFGEPSTGPAVFGLFNATKRDDGQVNAGDFASGASGGITTPGNDVGSAIVGSGIHRLIIKNDFFNGLVSFSAILDIPSLDADPNTLTGTPIFIGSLDSSDNDFNGIDDNDTPEDPNDDIQLANGNIFFGGGNAAHFDNFVISDVNDVPIIPCNVTGSTACNSTDFEVIRDNLFTAGGREQGDLTGDGFVDLEDFRLFKDDPTRVLGFDAPLAGLSIPEPTSLAIMGVYLLLSASTKRLSALRQGAC